MESVNKLVVAQQSILYLRTCTTVAFSLGRAGCRVHLAFLQLCIQWHSIALLQDCSYRGGMGEMWQDIAFSMAQVLKSFLKGLVHRRSMMHGCMCI